LDAIRLNKDIQQYLSKEALAEIETELANARQLQATEMASAMKEMQAALAGKEKEMQQAMAEAQVQLKAAEAQLEKTQEGLKELRKDGLLKNEEQVQIEWKDGTLYINGEAQTKAVSEKYKKYFGEELKRKE
jgi:translation initiation factor 2 beta subunit (eIF-2beta)/eIF-5